MELVVDNAAIYVLPMSNLNDKGNDRTSRIGLSRRRSVENFDEIGPANFIDNTSIYQTIIAYEPLVVFPM